jgi:putative hydrolase of the HAD superfamily
MSPNKFIFIDLDNTLYDYQNAHNPAEKELISFLSKNYQLSNSSVKKIYENSKKSAKSYLGSTAGSHSRLIYLTHFNLFKKSGINLEKILTGDNIYWNSFFMHMQLFDGVSDFLNTARHKGFKVVLITDLTTAIQYRKIKALGIANLIDIVITSEDAGGDKSTGNPEKLLRDLYGEMAGICIGDSASDHVFRNSTVFYRKISKINSAFNKSRSNFTCFKKLSRELFADVPPLK